MRNIGKEMLFGALSLLLCNMAQAQEPSAVQCVEQPTCEELGYTQNASDCYDNNYTACQFDPTFVKCDQRDSCNALGYTQKADDCIGDKMVRCQFDPNAVMCLQSISCEDLGFTDNIAKCPGEYDVCQYDKTKGKCIYEARPGDLKYSLRTSDHNGWLLCNGRGYMKAQFPELYSAISGSFGSYLPDYRGYFIKGAATTSASNLKPEIGYGKEEAGLPNITGTYYSIYSGGASEGTGAITQTNVESTNRKGGSSGDHWGRLSFDASRSNSIYGKSDTVTPQNYKANVFIFAGKKNSINVNGKYWLSGNTVASTCFTSTSYAYGLSSNKVIFGGNSTVQANSGIAVYSAAVSACQSMGGQIASATEIASFYGKSGCGDLAVVSTSKEYTTADSTIRKITGANAYGSQIAWQSSKQYYYYCVMTLPLL